MAKPKPAESEGVPAPFEYVFPAIRGIQAHREYFISMCPLRLLPKLFLFDEEELIPELRAQRTLNKARLPEMSRYILNNRNNYTFSAITASVDGDVHFDALSKSTEGQRVGLLHIPMSARFVINDGQHRRAAIELALRENPDLGDESIAVVFFLDRGLERCQQMFADLNRHAVRPTKSIGILYDHRDDRAHLARLIVMQSPFFKDVVETEKSSLSARSRRLFTLSAIYQATVALTADIEGEPDRLRELATDFWHDVAQQFPEWNQVRAGKLSAGEVRRDFIHSHGIVLQALGRAGNVMLKNGGVTRRKLGKLKQIDWSRSNAKVWEGRATIGGRVSKSGNNVTLTTNVIKQQLGVPLTPEEQRIEDSFRRGIHGR